ncbi:choice-of-anchor Q domain-containing protein [Labilibaculum sp. K2S]|uniref:choice-of-anchor Q domain-containing protein n=1 Tax=Labilibaculum sp. K2S TaxID=3056386 RepID=UPI0025A3551F|nr:choice-of-anchor Q domain-containing protein [Labilibaculum sp. K2S]MDM8160605.1 choice-of-anchor Q domain-containing protein [Labilibaculum sp. K2S]
MHFYRLLFFVVISLTIISCDEDDNFTTDPNFKLSFSTDTVSFDTLFTGFGSTTKQLKVKNTSSNTINISHLYLQNSESAYRLNVNGIQSNDLIDIKLDAKDSLFIFVEVSLETKNEDTPRLLEDQLKFEMNGRVQEVILETFAQDVYIVNADIKNNTVWTDDRPYLITKPVWIDEGVDLIVNEGTRVYFRKNAALHVKGNFEVRGSFQKPVYFGSSRLEELYENVPGQWNGIYFYDGSTTHLLSHFILENGINGLSFPKTILDNNPILIEYGIIRNFTGKGLFALNSTIAAHDMLISNCGEECIRLKEDGSCLISHSTFYNSWFFSARSRAIISYDGPGEKGLTIRNCILYGNRSDELEFETPEHVSVQNSLLKLGNSARTNYASIFTECLFNEDPDFLDLEELNFSLSEQSPVINKGSIEFISTYLFDLAGNRRDNDVAPDMGCYEFSEIK